MQGEMNCLKKILHVFTYFTSLYVHLGGKRSEKEIYQSVGLACYRHVYFFLLTFLYFKICLQ